MPTVCIQTAWPRWPLFGRQTTLNVAICCAPVSSILAGQQQNGQVAGVRDTVYGSDGQLGVHVVPSNLPRIAVALLISELPCMSAVLAALMSSVASPSFPLAAALAELLASIASVL